MRVQRDHLTVLLNRLYDGGEAEFTIEHPADDIGELLHLDLGTGRECTVEFP